MTVERLVFYLDTSAIVKRYHSELGMIYLDTSAFVKEYHDEEGSVYVPI